MKSSGSAALPADFSRPVYCIAGLTFDAVDLASAERQVRVAATGRTPCFLSTPNLNFLIACQTDAAFRDSVIRSDLSIADGMPIVWLSRLLGIPIRERVAGSTLFERLRRAPGQKLAVYFFGGPDGVAEAACRQLTAENRGLRCAGFESPGFGSLEDMSRAATIERINASGADFLLVALGAKKGQAWIELNRDRITVPVISHLGAVVNFVAGTVRRAPPWMQHSGLEWLWRIREEPGLARRYLGDGRAFLQLLLTRVLPAAWQLWRHRPTPAALAAATLQLHEDADGIVLRISGPWTRDNLVPLRTACASAAALGGTVRVDLAGVTYLDMAALGLMLLLYGALSRSGRTMTCDPLSPAARRALHNGGCAFLGNSHKML